MEMSFTSKCQDVKLISFRNIQYFDLSATFERFLSFKNTESEDQKFKYWMKMEIFCFVYVRLGQNSSTFMIIVSRQNVSAIGEDPFRVLLTSNGSSKIGVAIGRWTGVRVNTPFFSSCS
jgi:hypothetical protein